MHTYIQVQAVDELTTKVTDLLTGSFTRVAVVVGCSLMAPQHVFLMEIKGGVLRLGGKAGIQQQQQQKQQQQERNEGSIGEEPSEKVATLLLP